MKKMTARYLALVLWIADNDEVLERSPEVLADLISVSLVADVTGRTPLEVAQDVARLRDA